MNPTALQYPDFVPNQLLTSDSLNRLFSYLDEQSRATRTNLLGIGIACGLEVSATADGKLNVSTGTGVTSEGYLVTLEAAQKAEAPEYSYCIEFDFKQEISYPAFADAEHLELWELRRTAAGPDTLPLSTAFLSGNGDEGKQKVVLLFVELLRTDNKNCNPESCDDNGATVNVNLRLLLANKADVLALGLDKGTGDVFFNRAYTSLPELHMPRFDVVATELASTGALLAAFASVLSKDFLNTVESAIGALWSKFSLVLGDEFSASTPFVSPTPRERLAFLWSGGLTANQLASVQYCYDFVADLVASYQELRTTSLEILSLCCPDPTLFPRHLLLGLASPDATVRRSEFRHYFTSSPLFQRRDLHGRLRSLFKRLMLQWQKFEVPAPAGGDDKPDDSIRITPSALATLLSNKAIPFYYAADPLYQHWSYERSEAGAAAQNLGYRSSAYATEDAVRTPLRYDLEPFDFLRIEGHVGKRYSHVLANLKRIVSANRLPIDVIALATGTDPTRAEVVDVSNALGITAQFELLRDKLRCCLGKYLAYWGALDVSDLRYGGLTFPKLTPKEPIAVLPTDVTLGERVRRKKGDALLEFLPTPPASSVGSDFLRVAQLGDFDFGYVYTPTVVVFSREIVQRYALAIVDELETLIGLLSIGDVLELNAPDFEKHRELLEKNLNELWALVEKELAAQRLFDKLRAYLGEANRPFVDALAATVPDLEESYVDSLIFYYFNSDRVLPLDGLQSSRDPVQIRAMINARYQTLRADQVRVPPELDVKAAQNPRLVELANRLQTFDCLCDLAGLKTLQTRLREAIEALRGSNLFTSFIKAHPGIQHKAGVSIGGTFLVVYHRASTGVRGSAAARFEDAAKQLPDGAVVADFYLPYLSYSLVPPVVYRVTEGEPVPETVALSLERNPNTNALIYSVTDTKPYKFEHIPDGGTLINGTPANGVPFSVADKLVFIPSGTAALLGTQQTPLEIEFAYEKQGKRSSKLTVTVWNGPRATISTKTPTPTLGNSVQVDALVELADGFSWNVVDPTGAQVTTGTTTPTLTFTPSRSGLWTISLDARQSQTGVVKHSNVLPLSVRASCGELRTLVERYNKLRDVDRDNFDGFNQQILVEHGIYAYFKALGAHVAEPVEKQVEFFGQPIGGQALGVKLGQIWLRRCWERARDNEKQRLLAFETFRLLVDLALYVACIRDNDLEATLPFLRLFEALPELVKEMRVLAPTGSNEEISLKALRESVQTELAREETTTPPKQNYVKLLKQLLESFGG